jgi:hypothetical protein
MSGRKKAKSPLVREPAAAADAETKIVATKTGETQSEGDAGQDAKPQKVPRRRKRGASALESRIGYRFTALTFRRSRGRATAPAAISGSNSSAITCSAW